MLQRDDFLEEFLVAGSEPGKPESRKAVGLAD